MNGTEKQFRASRHGWEYLKMNFTLKFKGTYIALDWFSSVLSERARLMVSRIACMKGISYHP